MAAPKYPKTSPQGTLKGKDPLQIAQQIAATQGVKDAITASLASQQKSLTKAQDRLASINTAMINANKAAAADKAAISQLLKQPQSSARDAQIAKLNAQYTQDNNSYLYYKKEYDAQAVTVGSIQDTINHLNKELAAGKIFAPPASSNASPKGGGASKADNGAGSTITYKYNAPMVTSAYLGKGIQSQMLGVPGLITSPQFDSSIAPWSDGKTAKGVIRMSKHFADIAPKPTNSNAPGSTSSQIYDPNPYGLRFLYNPTSVSMAWGIVDSFSPQFESMGLDKAQNVSVGLMKSAITFSLMFNRIGDMAYINANGFKNPSDFLSQETASAISLYDSLPGVTAAPIPTSPYPSDVDVEELKQIYKRGTMYDMEYLFRTTGGYSSQYKSTLNGNTADKGWLQPIPVELHLGDGLRYLVRVSSLDLQHLVFNERMVPVITTVNITCTRYFDGPEMFTTVSTSSTTAGLSSSDVFGAAQTSATTVVK